MGGTVDCEQSDKPGFFARTSAVTDWIEDTVCNVFDSEHASFCEDAAPRCENDEDFYWKTFQNRDCAWIASNPNRIDNYCTRSNSDGVKVSESCPETCSSLPVGCPTEENVGSGCENDEGFYWKTFENRNCAWIASNPKRIDNYCHKTNSDGVKVSESCPETCRSIPAECSTLE